MSDKAAAYAGKDIPICSYRDSCIYPLFAEPAMFRPCRNSLAPLHAIAFGGIFRSLLRQIYAVSALMFKVRRWKK